jgi:hypothetical protein
MAAETPSATGDNKNDNTKNTPTVFTTELSSRQSSQTVRCRTDRVLKGQGPG